MIKETLLEKVLAVIGFVLVLPAIPMLGLLRPTWLFHFATTMLLTGFIFLIAAFVYSTVRRTFYGLPLTPADLKDGEYRILFLLEHRTFLVWGGDVSLENKMRAMRDKTPPFYFPLDAPRNTTISITLETEKIRKTTRSGTAKTAQRIVRVRWMEEGGEKTTTQSIPL